MRLICLKQLSEAGPSLVLFATCPRGRQLWSNHFFIYFLMLVCLPCIHDIKPIFSVSHKQRDWTRSSFVCCLSQARGRLVVNVFFTFFSPALSSFVCIQLRGGKQCQKAQFSWATQFVCGGLCYQSQLKRFPLETKLFLHLGAPFDHFVHREYQGVICHENDDRFDGLFTNCTRSVWSAWKLFIGGRCVKQWNGQSEY